MARRPPRATPRQIAVWRRRRAAAAQALLSEDGSIPPAVISALAYDPVANRISFATDQNQGTVWYLLDPSPVPILGAVLQATVEAGTATGGGFLAAPFGTEEDPVDINVDWSGVTPGAYHLHVTQATIGSDNLPIHALTQVIPVTVEVPAAVLSGLAYTVPAGPVGVTTTAGDGTIYYRARPSADPAADATTVIAGGGAAATSGAVTAAGAQSLAWNLSSLSGAHQIDAVHRRAGITMPWVDSAVASLAAPVTLGAFDPATLPGARIVVDVSDIGTLWQNTDGTNAVTASGQSVGSVTNRGSLGGLFTNTGGTARPVYTEASGRKFVAFDGSNDFLQLTHGSNVSLQAGFSMWFVMREAGANSTRRFAAAAPASAGAYNNDNGFRCGTSLSTDTAINSLFGLDNSAGLQGLSDTTAATLALAVVEFEIIPGSPTNSGVLRTEYAGDGAPIQRATAVTSFSTSRFPNLATAVRRFSLGCGLNGTGTPSTPDEFASMDLMAYVLIVGTLTTAERNDVRAWCRARAVF